MDDVNSLVETTLVETFVVLFVFLSSCSSRFARARRLCRRFSTGIREKRVELRKSLGNGRRV